MAQGSPSRTRAMVLRHLGRLPGRGTSSANCRLIAETAVAGERAGRRLERGAVHFPEVSYFGLGVLAE